LHFSPSAGDLCDGARWNRVDWRRLSLLFVAALVEQTPILASAVRQYFVLFDLILQTKTD
jgi:hypothetical protein